MVELTLEISEFMDKLKRPDKYTNIDSITPLMEHFGFTKTEAESKHIAHKRAHGECLALERAPGGQREDRRRPVAFPGSVPSCRMTEG